MAQIRSCCIANLKKELLFFGKTLSLDNLQEQIMNQKIDPNRLWHNMGTANKIGAGIGIILAGIGSGLTHTPNAALQVLHDAADKDIEAQKQDLGKKQTLYSMNLQKYRDQTLADNATRLQLNAAAQAQIQQAVARAGSQQAAAQGMMMLGQLKNQQFQMLTQFGGAMAKAKMLGLGSGDGGVPVAQVPYSILSDPKQQEQMVNIGGKMYYANDKDSAGKVRTAETLAGPVMQDIQTLKELGPGAMVPGSDAWNKAHAIRGDLAIKLTGMSGNTIGAKRINSEEIKYQLDRIRDPSKFSNYLGDSKTNEFYNSIQNEMESLRKNNLIGYKGMSGLGFNALPTGGKLPLNNR